MQNLETYTLSLTLGMLDGAATLEYGLVVSQSYPFALAIPPLDICLREMKTYVSIKTCIQMFMVALFQKWEQLLGLLTDG